MTSENYRFIRTTDKLLSVKDHKWPRIVTLLQRNVLKKYPEESNIRRGVNTS